MIQTIRFFLAGTMLAMLATPAQATHFTASQIFYQSPTLGPNANFGGVIQGSSGNTGSDFWRFQAINGGTVTFTVSRTSGSLRPNLRILRNVVPNGASVFSAYPILATDTNSFSGFNSISYTTNFTGLATLQISNWLGDTGSYTATIRTQGGAPDLAISPGSIDFGNVRVGTSASESLTATNTGFGTLTGNFNSPAGSSDFAGPTAPGGFSLGQNQSTSRSYTYTPDARGFDGGSITVSSNGGNETAGISGVGVGPVYASTPGTPPADDAGNATMISFDAVDTVLGPSSTTENLTIANITTDGDLGSLTDLSLLSAVISGADGSQFSIDFTPTVLAAGDDVTFELTFSEDVFGPNGMRNALLEIVTDQGAAFGDVGASFFYQLKGLQTPEPGSILLWSMIGAGGYFFRRRRQNTLAA